MYILKRSGRREKFDGDKIRCAIEKANLSVGPEDRVSKTVIGRINPSEISPRSLIAFTRPLFSNIQIVLGLCLVPYAYTG